MVDITGRSRFSMFMDEIVANAEVWRAVNSALRSFGRTPSVGNTDGVSVGVFVALTFLFSQNPGHLLPHALQ